MRALESAFLHSRTHARAPARMPACRRARTWAHFRAFTPARLSPHLSAHPCARCVHAQPVPACKHACRHALHPPSSACAFMPKSGNIFGTTGPLLHRCPLRRIVAAAALHCVHTAPCLPCLARHARSTARYARRLATYARRPQMRPSWVTAVAQLATQLRPSCDRLRPAATSCD